MTATRTSHSNHYRSGHCLAALALLLFSGLGLALEIPSDSQFRVPLNGMWSVYVDASGSAELRQIRKQRYQFVPQSQFQPPLAPLQTYWLRLALENPSASARILWLELDAAQARNAQLYIISGPYIKTLGLSPTGENGSQGRLTTMDFPITVAANASTELYLRLNRPWQTGFDATLVDSWSHQRSSHQRMFISGASLGGLLVLLLLLLPRRPEPASNTLLLGLVIVTGIFYAATRQGWLLLLAPVNDSSSGLLRLAPLFCQASFLVALLLYSRIAWPPGTSPRAIIASRWIAIVATVMLLLVAAFDFGLGFYGLAIMECLTLLLLSLYFVALLLAGDRHMLFFISGLLLYGVITWPQLAERIAPLTGVYPGRHLQLPIAASSLPGTAVLGLTLLFALGQYRSRKHPSPTLKDDTTAIEDNLTLQPAGAGDHPVQPEWWRLLEASFDGVLICEHGRVLYCNKAAESILGPDRNEIVGKPLSLVLGSGSDSDSLLRETASKPIHLPRAEDKDKPHLELSSRRHIVGHRALTLVSLRENDPLKAAGQSDKLTGLPALELLHEHYAKLDRKAKHAVLLIKLDQLTALQQRYGRQRSDQFVKALATRMGEAVPRQAMMSLWDDLQFVLLLKNIDSEEVATAIAVQLLKQVHQPITIDEREMLTSASIGISVYPGHAGTLEELLELAQRAAELAQQRGGDDYQIYHAPGHAGEAPSNGSARVFVTSFHEAQRKRNFTLVEEPIMAIAGHTQAGVRLLPCWPDLPRPYRNAAQLYTMASQTGIAKTLSEQLLRDACRFGRTVGKARGGPVNIRVTLEHFQTPRFIESASSLIASSGARAEQLLLSFDEPGLLSDIDHSRARLSQLRQLGFSLGMDNFSDSARAFGLLRGGLFDEVGFSIPWIKSMGTQKRDLQMLETLVKLCHSLELRVRVDQVSTEQHLKVAAMLDCDCVSGAFVDSLLGDPQRNDPQ